MLPLIALPALDAEIGFTDRLAHHQRRLRVDEHVLIWTGTIGAPYYAPILNAVGCQGSAYPVFSAGVAYEDLVAHDERRHGDRFTRGKISILDLPDFLASLRVERDDVVVERRHEQLAIGVGRATIDEIAAGHRNRILIGTRIVFPLDLPRTIEVDGVDDEGLRCLEIEHAVDHKRAAFVPTQDAGGDLPADFQVFDVGPVDLV
jgi:hypothetical protein